jgi:hypothetical protein
MPVTITGHKYTGALTSVGTTTIVNSGASFSSGDFTSRRLVGLWSSGGTFKGFSFARRWISGTQIELTYQFVSPTGTTVAQVSGDVYRVSKNYAESVTTGIAVSGNVVTISDRLIFGANGDGGSVCFYDEDKQIVITSAATSGTTEPFFRMAGGITVHGYLSNFTDRVVANGCSIINQNTAQAIPLGTGGIACSSTAAKLAFFGGSLFTQNSPCYAGTYYSGVWATLSTPAEFQFYWGLSTNLDMNINDGGAFAALQQVVNISSTVSKSLAQNLAWAGGVVEGGTFTLLGSLPLAVFASDAAGTYNIGAPAGRFLNVTDVGFGARPALWRSNVNVVQTINFTNVVTPNRKLGWDNGPIQNPGTDPNNNATGRFRFSGIFSGLISGSLAVVRNNNIGTTIADSATVSGSTQSFTVLEATVVGHTETINENSWLWAFLLYGYQILSGTFATESLDLGSPGTAKRVSFGGPVGQVLDSSMSQAVAATVAAYTTLTTFDRVYDYAQYFKALNTTNAVIPALNQQLIASSSGTLNTPVAYNIVIDSAAGSVFAVNTGTTTITLKPTTAIASGTKNDTLQISSGRTLTFAQNGDKTSGKYIAGSGATIVVASGETNLRGSTLTGCTINTDSTATVIVDSVTGIIAGPGVTLQEPTATLRLFNLPTVANTVLRIKDLTSLVVTNPLPVAGEVTITVNAARSYEVRADAPGYLMQRVTLSGSTPEFSFSLQNFRTLYNSGSNISAQIAFNYGTLVVTITDSAPTISFADMFRTIEDYLATTSGLEFDSPPYPVVLPDRNILWFPLTPAAGVNPVRVKPNAANTTDPTLLFETYLEGAADPTYSLFDFVGVGGRIIRVRSVVAIANPDLQAIRDAMKLAPSAGVAAVASIDNKLDVAARNAIVTR